MKTRVEIEAAIAQLPEAEVRQLAQWLQHYLDDSWDKQMKEDLASGKLDKLIAEAEADIDTHRVRELDGILGFQDPVILGENG
ncbi:hypothetical protein [Laspinema olomoucense]|uniref:hypothetical protein n=1 Tax=Laspinema olomoucense TaxID=3231600 RepID=UPI0021BB0032|nr:hypothetical protein [Laspinema sp. D3a]MCT7990446.1 hypothetical protein [Laspinema sp. D3a]